MTNCDAALHALMLTVSPVKQTNPFVTIDRSTEVKCEAQAALADFGIGYV